MSDGVKATGSRIRAASGEVLVEGANGVVLTLTPKAAMQMADDLNAAAIKAFDQCSNRRPR